MPLGVRVTPPEELTGSSMTRNDQHADSKKGESNRVSLLVWWNSLNLRVMSVLRVFVRVAAVEKLCLERDCQAIVSAGNSTKSQVLSIICR